jgi:hypothetical protein
MPCTLTTVLQTRVASSPWTNNEQELFEYDVDTIRRHKTKHPFRFNQNQMYGFLSNVYNWSGIHPLTDPRGLPPDLDLRWAGEYLLLERGKHQVFSYVTLEELLRFDYELVYFDILFNQERSVRSVLGPRFFEHLAQITNLNTQRDLQCRVVLSFNY